MSAAGKEGGALRGKPPTDTGSHIAVRNANKKSSNGIVSVGTYSASPGGEDFTALIPLTTKA